MITEQEKQENSFFIEIKLQCVKQGVRISSAFFIYSL